MLKNEMDLVALVPALKRGDREAFSLLFRRYYPKVKGFAFRIPGEEWGAEDVAQNVFYKIWCMREGLMTGSANLEASFNAFSYVCLSEPS